MPLCRYSVETCQERTHTQLVREHSATVVSARRATVDRSWRKEWNQCARANFRVKEKKRRQGMNGRTVSQNPRKQGKSHNKTTPAAKWTSTTLTFKKQSQQNHAISHLETKLKAKLETDDRRRLAEKRTRFEPATDKAEQP